MVLVGNSWHYFYPVGNCPQWEVVLEPHTLICHASVLQRLDSRGIEALILILEKVLNCRYDLIIGPILLPSQVFLSCRGTENSQMVPNQENMEADQPDQSHIHTQQPLQPQTCNVCGSFVLVKQDHLRQFSRPF